MEAGHAAPLHNADYIFLSFDSAMLLGLAMLCQLKPPNIRLFSVSPPEIYSHTQLCALTSMGLGAVRTRWSLNVASTVIFHHLKRSALPEGPWSLIPPHLKWETAGTGVAAPQNRVPVCAALLTHMSWEVLEKTHTERTFWAFKVQLPCLFAFSEFLKKHLEGVSFLSCLVNILHSSSGHVF